MQFIQKSLQSTEIIYISTDSRNFCKMYVLFAVVCSVGRITLLIYYACLVVCALRTLFVFEFV